MNLSTSNSSAVTSTGTDALNAKAAVSIYTQVVLKLGLSMLVAILIIYGYLVSMGATGQGILERVNEARQALPNIVAESNDVTLFFGSSLTQFGISPRQFEQEMLQQKVQTSAFNFGFGGLNPYFQDLLSRRIVDEFVKEDKKIELAVIEFNPFQATQTRWNRALPSVDSYLTLLASNRELYEFAEGDVERLARLFTIKYLRSGVSAEMITSYLAHDMFPTTNTQSFSDSEAVIAEQRRLGQLLSQKFDEEYPNFVESSWSYVWRGAGTIPSERSPETLALFESYYDAVITEARMKNDRLWRIRSTGIEQLMFEPLMLEHFVNVVNNFKQISNNVKVIMLPKNSRWIKTTPEADMRLKQALAVIENSTGITVDDHQQLGFINAEMFIDTTHLARYRGDVVYTNYLVQQYGQLLK